MFCVGGAGKRTNEVIENEEQSSDFVSVSMVIYRTLCYYLNIWVSEQLIAVERLGHHDIWKWLDTGRIISHGQYGKLECSVGTGWMFKLKEIRPFFPNVCLIQTIL